MDKLARIFDNEILPVWSEPFGRLLLRELDVPPGGQVLDVSCATGYPAVEILRRMGGSGRLIAIDGASALLDLARRKVQALGAKNAFLRTESAVPRLSFAGDVYDLVVCHLGLPDMPSMSDAIADFARVTKMGGEVRCTLPLAGTFAAFYDLFRAVLQRRDRQEALARLDRHLARYPSADTCEAWMHAAGLGDVRVTIEPFSLHFGAARELFFAPAIEHGFLTLWKAIAGQGQDMQDVFWELKDALDGAIGARGAEETPGFEMVVQAGCIAGRKERAVAVKVPAPAVAAAHRDEVTEHVLDESDIEEVREPLTAHPRTSQIDLADIEEIGATERSIPGEATATRTKQRLSETVRLDDVGQNEEGGLDLDDLAGIALDAFVAGMPRPSHLAPADPAPAADLAPTSAAMPLPNPREDE